MLAGSTRSQIDTPYALKACMHPAIGGVCQFQGCAHLMASNNWLPPSTANIEILPKWLVRVYINISKDGESSNSVLSTSCLTCIYRDTRLRLPHLWVPNDPAHTEQANTNVLGKSQGLDPELDSQSRGEALFIWLQRWNQTSMAKRRSRLFEALSRSGQTETLRVQVQRRQLHQRHLVVDFEFCFWSWLSIIESTQEANSRNKANQRSRCQFRQQILRRAETDQVQRRRR